MMSTSNLRPSKLMGLDLKKVVKIDFLSGDICQLLVQLRKIRCKSNLSLISPSCVDSTLFIRQVADKSNLVIFSWEINAVPDI